METKPHGWAATASGKMMHYFGLGRSSYGSIGYRADGTPLALCHNALKMDAETGFENAPPPGWDSCAMCCRYLAEEQTKARKAAAQASGKFGVGVSVKVLRGKLAGKSGDITEKANDFPGFWWVYLGGNRPVLLGEGQLELKK